MRKSGILRLGFSVGIVIAALFLVALLSQPDEIVGPCMLINSAMLPEVPEASGLAVSRRTPGVLWAHNDSDNATVLFALDAAGVARGRVRIPVRTRDWEDISAGHCATGDCLYIGDIGDNAFSRRRIEIYRIFEPAPDETETAAPEVISATYPDGPHNAEAMFLIGDDLFIVTRDRDAGVYRANATRPGNVALQRIGQLRLEESVVTDAEASPDENSVAVRTSHEVLLYRAADLIGGRNIPYSRIPIDGLREIQGEGVAFDGTMLYLASEGWQFNRAGRLLSLRCNFPQ